jgi:uncharacterized protein (DUF488 family)
MFKENRGNKMKTSYFRKSGLNPNAVSIAGKAPSFFKGKKYEKLAPKYRFFIKYKKGEINKKEYTKYYYEEILNKLNPIEVYKELGEEAVLLCWEGKGKFCHRHIVAKWLSKNLNIIIEEI